MEKRRRASVVLALILLAVATTLWLWTFFKSAPESGTTVVLPAAKDSYSRAETLPTSSGEAIGVAQSGSGTTGVNSDKGPSLVHEINVRDIELRAPYLLRLKGVDGLLTHYEIHRRYGSGLDYELGIERNIGHLRWRTYPPVSFIDALSVARNSEKIQEPIAPYGEQLLHFRNSLPSYAFRSRFSSDRRYLLVDAESGSTSWADVNAPSAETVDKTRDSEYLQSLRRYVGMRGGRMLIASENLHELSETTRTQLLKDVELTNQMLESGELVLDDNFQVIYQRQ